MTGGALQNIAEQLERVQPSAAMIYHTDEELLANELGYPALLYWRDSEPVETPRGIRRRWAARCYCSVCTMTYTAGWNPEGGIRMVDDLYGGGVYPGIPKEDENATFYEDGDALFCPFCCEQVEVTRRTALPPNGRTRRLMQQDLQIFEADGVRYAVILGWLRSRRIDRLGTVDDLQPVEAAVVDTDGRLIRLKRHITCGGGQVGTLLPHWERARTVWSLDRIRYYSDEAINCTKVGSAVLPPIEPEALAGTTAEKTGLAELSAEGTANTIEYLQAWRQHPYLENLVKSGWGYTVAQTFICGGHLQDWADLTRGKPTEQLGMSRAEVRALGAKRWDWHTARALKQYRAAGGDCTATEWDTYNRRLGYELMCALADGGIRPEKAARYLAKQNATGQTLADTWRMSETLGLDMQDPQIRFPKHLKDTHDRLTVAVAAQDNAEKAARYQAKFDAISEQYGHLEWSDGELCIRLPRSLTELIQEGAVLHHCVGGYGDRHTRGSDVIFFVRHARRPERSWYTLDIRMNDGAPREIQLHGYKNEWCNGKTLHIPRQVREFCDRWEREILLPRWKQAQKQAKAKSTDKKKKENAA